MKHSGISGQKVARVILPLFLMILPFWDLAGGRILTIDPQEQITETATVDITYTTQALDLPTSQETETATPVPESSTATLPVAGITEEVSVNPQISDQTLGTGFASSQVLVRFRNQASKESIEQCIQAVDASVISDIEELDTFILSIPTGQIAQSIIGLESCPDLHYVEPNYLVQIADIIPFDPGWGYQYGLIKIRAPQGWQMSTGSSSITIAILDTGIDMTHLDLAGKLVGGINIINPGSSPQDDNGHGTHVAGIAAALSNNGTGVAGVSWGARLMPVKVLDAAGNGTYANVADGIIWATDHGAQIINLSLGGGKESQTLQEAVNYAAARGVLLVAATGNTGSNFVLYPARYPNVIAVAATDGSNARSTISSYGDEVDLVAPGIAIYSTVPGGYNYDSGTSMSAPYVSGLAAILLGIPGNGSSSAVTQQMESTALDLGSPGWDSFYGYGLIQMDAALQLVLGNTIPTSSSSVSTVSLPGFVQLPTLTLTATFTSLPAQPETGTPSPTTASTETHPQLTTETAEVIALGTDLPAAVESDPNMFLPCLGLFLILLGISLFWVATPRRKKNRVKLMHFR